MTSKNLCFKLMREDIKRRGWTIALTVLGLLFTTVIPTAIKCGELTDLTVQDSPVIKYMQQSVVKLLKTGSMAAVFLIVASVLWAVSGFHYLHNNKKVDFYHSIPVRRRQLFLAIYVNGILVPAVIYLAVLLISVGIALQAGVSIKLIGILPIQGYVLHLLYYSLLYTTTVVAMMLTGNVVIALMGTTVFCSYGPAVVALTLGYFNAWFHTFSLSAGQERKWILAMWNTSPLGNYIGSIGDFNSGMWYIHRLAGVLIITILLAGLSYALYRLRPSEAAGKAMAFSCSRMPVKVLIVIPVSVAFGIFFYLLRSNLTWLVFGSLCGCVLCHCLMEIIYHFDFRRLFSNKIHLACCMAVSLMLAFAGYFDWYGYDSWLPEASDVKSAAISMRDTDEWVTYGQIASMPRGDGGIRFYWSYKNKTNYCFENMSLTDISQAMELADRGVREDERIRKNESSGDYLRTNCTVQFCMKNGKQVYRSYSLPLDEELKQMYASIHDNPEYKQGAYPVMKQTGGETGSVQVQQYGKRMDVDLAEAGRSRLLEAYQREWLALTAKTRGEELPVGIIRFGTKQEEQFWKEYQADKEGKSFSYDLMDNCYYPIYPSFSETLGILKDAGITFMKLDENTISAISLDHYPIYDDTGRNGEMVLVHEGQRIFCEEKNDIKNLAPALWYREYYNMGLGFYRMNLDFDTGISVYFKDSDHPASFYLDLNKLSPEMARHYGFRLINTGE